MEDFHLNILPVHRALQGLLEFATKRSFEKGRTKQMFMNNKWFVLYSNDERDSWLWLPMQQVRIVP